MPAAVATVAGTSSRVVAWVALATRPFADRSEQDDRRRQAQVRRGG